MLTPGKIAAVIAAGEKGGTLAQVGNSLHDALDLIREMNAVLSVVHGTLQPVADLDWHGKWRIQKAMALTETADADLAHDFFEAKNDGV